MAIFREYILVNFCLDRASWYFVEQIGINPPVEPFDVFTTPCS